MNTQNDSGLVMVQNSTDFSKVPMFSLKNSQQQRDGSMNKMQMGKREDSENSNGRS